MELQKLYVSLMMEMKQYTAGLDDAIGQARSFGDRLRSTLGTAAVAGGLAVASGLAVAGGAIVGLGASSVGVATEFQSSMAIMSTAVDPVSLGVESTAEAMGILSDASLAVGSDTALVGVSASTSAEAITGLYKAGLSTAEIFGDLQGYLAGTAELSGALRASIDLAAASELDMVQASDLAAVTLATFGGHLETEAERAEFINDAMNNFVQTADASVASVGDLQAAFVNVGPTAAAMGMGVGDVNTALGILSTRGITGSEAGTALKSMLVNLQRTTPDVTDTLDALGVSLYDAQGVMYSLPEIIGQLETSMAGMTDEQRQQTVVTLAGSYGMNAMNTLLGEGVAGWTAMEEAVAGAATMQETAAARTNTLAGAQEALSGVWESFQIEVGTALVPVLMTLADVGASLIEKYGPALTAVFETIGGVLSGFFANLQEGMSPLDAFIEAIWDIAPQPVLDALINLRDNILPAVMTAFRNFTTPIIEFVQAHGPLLMKILEGLAIAFAAFTIITTVVGWISGLVAAVSALGGAITAAGGVLSFIVGILGGPVTIVIGLVAGAIALLKLAWDNNWGGIQEKVAAVWGFLQPIFALIVEWIGNKIRADLELLRAAWVDVVWPAIQRVIEIVWPVIQRIFTAISDFIVDTLIPTIKTLYEKWTTEWWPTIQTVLENVWTVVEAIFTEIGRWVNDNIVPWIEYLREQWVDVVWPAIQRGVEAAWEIIEPIWEAIRKWAAETIPPIIEELKTIFETVMSGISAAIQPVKQVWDGFVGAVQGFWNWIKDKVFNFNIHIPDLPDWVTPPGGDRSVLPIHKAWEEFSKALPGIAQRISDGFEDIADSVEAATDILDPNGPVFEGIDKILGMAGSIGSIAGGFAKRFEQTVIRPMEDQLAVLDGTIGSIVPLFDKVMKPFGGAGLFGDWTDPKQIGVVLNQLTNMRNVLASQGDWLGVAQVDMALDALAERNNLNQEYMRQQERLLALEQARADLDFLKSQMELIKLVKDNHLPPEVLAGLQFGLAADPGVFLDMFVGVMEMLVNSASHELNLNASSPALDAPTPGTERTATYNVQNQTINGGQNIYIYDAEESELERLGVLSR